METPVTSLTWTVTLAFLLALQLFYYFTTISSPYNQQRYTFKMKVISHHSRLSILQRHQSCFFNVTCSLLGHFSPWNDLTQTICDSLSDLVRSFLSSTSSGCLLWPPSATAAPHHCLSSLHSHCFILFHRTCSYLTLDTGCLRWVVCLPH